MRFKTMEHLGEEHEVGGALLDVGEDGSNSRPHQSSEGATRQENDEERRETDVGQKPGGHRRGAEHAQHGGNNRNAMTRKGPGCRSPF